MKALVDNDILLKGSCYGLLRELVAAVPGNAALAGILGAARFIIPKLIAKQDFVNTAPARAQERFESFIRENAVVEPTAEEQRLAAQLESTAQHLAVNLDSGESQLVAILVRRTIPFLATGDKRAIVALERLLDAHGALSVIGGRITCLEQLVRRLLEACDHEEIRKAICAEPKIDKTLTICFGCASPTVDRDAVRDGLNSYIAALRRDSARVLST
jgi:hypothetical protein